MQISVKLTVVFDITEKILQPWRYKYIDDMTQVVISYEISYEMTTSVIFCLSYDLSKGFFIVFKMDIILTKNALLSRTSS